MSARKPKLYLDLSVELVGMSKPCTVLPPNEPISPGADREMVGAGVMGGGSAVRLTPQPGDAPPMPRLTDYSPLAKRKPEGPSIPRSREGIPDGSIEDAESSPVSKVRADKSPDYSP